MRKCIMIMLTVGMLGIWAASHASAGNAADAAIKNYVYNGSFEKATNPGLPDGWEVAWRDEWVTAAGLAEQYQALGAPKYTLSGETDRQEAYHGKQSFRLSGTGGAIGVYELRYLKKGYDYTFSLYLKADTPDLPVIVVQGYFDQVAIFKTGQTWKRYVCTFAFDRDYESWDFKIVNLGQGNLWIDAVQLEEGKTAGPYVDSLDYDKIRKKAF